MNEWMSVDWSTTLRYAALRYVGQSDSQLVYHVLCVNVRVWKDGIGENANQIGSDRIEWNQIIWNEIRRIRRRRKKQSIKAKDKKGTLVAWIIRYRMYMYVCAYVCKVYIQNLRFLQPPFSLPLTLPLLSPLPLLLLFFQVYAGYTSWRQISLKSSRARASLRRNPLLKIWGRMWWESRKKN